MDTLIINQQDKIDYSPTLQKVISDVADTAAKVLKLAENTELSILLVDNSYIQELNLTYRGINEPTDVLSFSMWESKEDEPDFDFSGDEDILGDIVISLEQADKQSKAYENTMEREIGYLVAHGILHLTGYDHETEGEKVIMRQLEEKIMKDVGLTR